VCRLSYPPSDYVIFPFGIREFTIPTWAEVQNCGESSICTSEYVSIPKMLTACSIAPSGPAGPYTSCPLRPYSRPYMGKGIYIFDLPSNLASAQK
jgi:hypothetical protein